MSLPTARPLERKCETMESKLHRPVDVGRANNGSSRVRMMYWAMGGQELAGKREEGMEAVATSVTSPSAERWPGPQLLVVPSLHPSGPTSKILRNIAGLQHYEERQLYHIFLLRKRDPAFRVLLVSSTDIPREIIAYYFRLMRSIGWWPAPCFH